MSSDKQPYTLLPVNLYNIIIPHFHCAVFVFGVIPQYPVTMRATVAFTLWKDVKWKDVEGIS